MQYQILIKQQSDNSFLATAIGLPECKVKAETKEQAVCKAKEAIEGLLSQGEIVVVEVMEEIKAYRNYLMI